MAIQLPQKQAPLGSVRLSLEDVRKIFERLARHVDEQGDREIASLQQPADQDEAQFERYKRELKEKAFRVTVTIEGTDGTSLFGDSQDLFSSPNLPDNPAYVFMTNVTAYKGVAGFDPANSFDLMIDFSKPPLVDAKNPVSHPTPNRSALNIRGDRDAWVASISEAVMGIVRNRRTKRAWLHAAFVYDIGLFMLGFPFGLYVCWRFSELIKNYLDPISEFLSAVAYLYIFLIMVWIYRFLNGYAKWAFPVVELSDRIDTAKRHRTIFFTILIAFVANIIWEVFSVASSKVITG